MPCIRLGQIAVSLGAIEIDIAEAVSVGRFAVAAIVVVGGVLLIVGKPVHHALGNGDNVGMTPGLIQQAHLAFECYHRGI